MVMLIGRVIIVGVCCLGLANSVSANVIPKMIEVFIEQGASAGDAETGGQLWKKKFYVDGQARSCQACHGADLRKYGSHIRTGKMIEPMALSVNPARFNEPKKIRKWFRRNCKWVLGRECSAQEKVDVLLFLQKQ